METRLFATHLVSSALVVASSSRVIFTLLGSQKSEPRKIHGEDRLTGATGGN